MACVGGVERGAGSVTEPIVVGCMGTITNYIRNRKLNLRNVKVCVCVVWDLSSVPCKACCVCSCYVWMKSMVTLTALNVKSFS